MSQVPANIIVALDYSDPEQAIELVNQLPNQACCLKVGKELFVRGGPVLVERWVKAGWRVFLDLKFHDIPHTVEAACQAATNLGVWMVDVHALGGSEMLEAAREAVEAGGGDRPLLIAVTILTSHQLSTLEEVGIGGNPMQAAGRLARLAQKSGLDGVVCSGHEVEGLRDHLGAQFRLVTPGIRPAGAAQDDQKRIMTPEEAVRAGASDLVIGRPITRADDPAAALSAIQTAIQRTEF